MASPVHPLSEEPETLKNLLEDPTLSQGGLGEFMPDDDDTGGPDAGEDMGAKLVYRADEELIKDFVENMCTEDQRERWYAFRRIKFSHGVLRKLAGQITGATTLPKTLPLVVSAVARTYLSEILVHARDAMADAGEDPLGPMAPQYLREGYRRYHFVQDRGQPMHHFKKRMF